LFLLLLSSKGGLSAFDPSLIQQIAAASMSNPTSTTTATHHPPLLTRSFYYTFTFFFVVGLALSQVTSRSESALIWGNNPDYYTGTTVSPPPTVDHHHHHHHHHHHDNHSQSSADARPAMVAHSPFNGSKAIVQIFDRHMEDYIYSIVSTHRAIKDLKLDHSIQHVVVYKEAPSSFDIKDRTTYGEMLEIRDCLTILNLLNITVLTYSDNKAFTEIGKISSKKPSDVKTHLESIFKDNHLERFLAKIYVFNLTMFDRILFLDNDIIPLLNFEDLFHVPMTPACAADVASGMVLNTGVMVIDPSREIFEAIVHDLMRDDPNPWRSANKGDELIDNDQDFINYFFGDRMYVLSPYWNILISIHHDIAGDGVASPVTEWGAFIEDSGRFINWLLKFKRNKRLVKMIHMGNPKPNWPLWTKDCTENSDNGSDDSLNGWKIPSKWPCPDGKTSRPDWWRWYFIESGEPGLAILSIHKTFWKRYVDEVATMCQKFSSAAQTTAKTTSLTSITSRICKYPYIVTSDMKHAGWYETILPTKSIKVWSELVT